MSESQTLKVELAPAGEQAASARRGWHRLEPVLLGTGSIIVLLQPIFWG